MLANRLTVPESRGMMRKPEGKMGASSEKDASIGAKTSSALVPTACSSTPLQSCGQVQPEELLAMDLMLERTF